MPLQVKKHTIPLLLLALVLLLGACTSNETTISKQKTKTEGKVAQGVTDKEILVGITGPQTGPVAEYDKPRKGIQAYFNYVNENGGVLGRKLKLVAYDDQYQPAKTISGVQKLVGDDKVFALLFPIGTSNISAIQSYAVNSGIPIVGVGTGADKFVKPVIRQWFINQFNYSIEAKIYTDYAIKKMGHKKIAIVYQNDDFGKQGLEATRKAVPNYGGAEIVAEIPFLATDSEFSIQVQKAINANPDVIIMYSVPAPAANFRKEMVKHNVGNIPFIVGTTGGSDPNQFNLAGKDVWEGTNSATQSPLENNEKTKLYVEQLTKYFKESDVGDLSKMGWSQAQIFVEALKRTKGDLSWENFISAMETFNKWDGSLYPSVTYNRDNHYGITTLYLFQAKNGERSLLNKITFDPGTEKITYD